MLTIVIVHFNTAALTMECLDSISRQQMAEISVCLVDNASSDAERTQLRTCVSDRHPHVAWIDAGSNLGFAGGCNLGIKAVLSAPEVTHIMLLNSDCLLEDGALKTILDLLSDGQEHDLLAGRVHRMEEAEQVDSLGIAMYNSGLASNRLDPGDPLIGPTGGLAIYSRQLIERMIESHGHFFDDDFFCYAEDTDVAWRALLMGYTPEYIDRRLARHVGQASSGGGFSDFVLYHGIRNSVWLLVKGFPAGLLPGLLPRAVVLHLGIMLRHGLRGKVRPVFRIYRDVLRGIPAMWRKRRRIMATRTQNSRAMRKFICPRFYDQDYLRNAIRDLYRRPFGGR